MKRNKTKTPVKRDINIAMNATMEVNYNTRTIKSKKLYDRKKQARIEY